TQQGSTVSGNTVAMDAGHDLGVSGSNVAGTGNVALQAGHDVTITAATNTASSSSYYEADHSGLFSSGMGFTLGHSRQTDQTNGSGTTQSSSRSLVGSTNGNLSITAGNAATVSGSDLVAGISNGQAAAGAGSGNLSIDAKTITIDPGADQQQSSEHQTFSQSGLSVSLGGAVVNAQQSIDQVAQAAQSTTDARVKALAGATAGLAAYNATQAVGNDAVSLSVTAGSSHSDSTSASSSLTHNGSTLNAAGNVDLNAHGGAQASNLTITGSQVKAGGNVNLSADNAVTLQAAQDTTSSQSASHGSSSAVGLGVSAGSSGWAAGVTASASRSRSQGHGSSLSQQNTTVSAGQSLAIHSGGDTTLAGAVASGRQVTADVGGNLNITSLQDTASSHSSGQSVGASVTAGVGFSGSASASSQHLDASYASVQQQSGLEAGDGGFQVKVQGHTGLTGGVIESSQAAVEQGRNRLITGTLTTASVANRGSYSGQSLGVSAGLSAGPGQSGQASTNGGAPQPTAGPSHEASFGNSANVGLPTVLNASGSAGSTTPSGISGGTITITNVQAQQQLTGQTTQQAVAGTNRNVSTGTNTANAIANPYNASQVQAAFTVTQAFTQQVGQFLATQAAQADAAQKALDQAKADPSATPQQVAQAQQQADAAALWAPGGAYNRILTAFTAAAGGNATGGATQLVQAAAVGYLQGLGAQQVKALADGLESQGQPNATSEAVRTALQALVGCAGAQAATGSCSAGAMGAAASVVLNDALDAAQGVSGESLSPSDKQNRQNLVGSLVAGIAAQAGVNANAASGSAQVETGNNALSLTQMAQAIQKTAGCLNTMDMGCVRQTVDAARKLDQAQSDAVDQGALTALQQRWQGVKNIPASLSNLASLIQSDPGQAAALLGQAIAQLPANLVHQYSGELQAIMTAYLSGTSPQQFQQAGAAMANLAVDVATVVASDGVAEVAGAGTSAALDAVNSGLAKMGISDALPVATNSAATGTVWDSITATQPNYPGSVIPQSFEMSLPNGQSVWVHGNATEHMAEYAQMVANNNPPGVVQLTTQQQLSSLQSAVNTATQGGVPYNQLINVGGWELKFAPPRQPGQLPALIHALPTGK
ncbi:MAG: hemagglutinin repeat-containing protein, partial [Betaproteobacteria bacterium]|nr:hemagglutinin repeat-containing protein [Betaproteobacteria bacterium]